MELGYMFIFNNGCLLKNPVVRPCMRKTCDFIAIGPEGA